MRIQFSSIHLKVFVTINQSLIIGTHREAAAILNFLISSLALSLPNYLIFQRVENMEAIFLRQRISRASLSFLSGIPLSPWLQEEKSHQFARVCVGHRSPNSQNQVFRDLESKGEIIFFYPLQNGLERFTFGLKIPKCLKAQQHVQKWRQRL